ncbi:MAG: hypothetical protein HRU71_11710 [Planctomycetia bacterium]|nr:MAG: hypothetical protein HRU71_11710 [Planctomycetia bacterium]
MTPQRTQPESCRKHGVILTCFVDGRKRFRAVPVHPESPEAINESNEPVGPVELRGLLSAIRRAAPSSGD